jgi:triacylglycerol esterase/lipase EstA (alpha/beta hydrolase family)
MRKTLRGSLLAAALLLANCGGSQTPDGDAGVSGGAKSDYPGEPALETDQARLDQALLCTPFQHPDKPPVLLVHGTFTAGFEQYDWTYLPLLADRGYDVCLVTYPDRGLGDQQVSAEYVVNALRRIHARSGRKVALVGHSQGASMPRWAVKWWPSARAALDDFVMLAGPNHGTTATTGLTALLAQVPGLGSLPIGLLPESFYQFDPNSNFVKAMNRGEEAPGEVSYTSIYSGFYDELVEPATPVPTAGLDWGQSRANVANILLQDVCPGRFVDHVTIGLTDALTFALVLDALEHPGPADPARAGGSSLCGLLPIVPDQIIAPEVVSGLLQVLQQEPANGLPNPHLSAAEPPLKPYAQQ